MIIIWSTQKNYVFLRRLKISACHKQQGEQESLTGLGRAEACARHYCLNVLLYHFLL